MQSDERMKTTSPMGRGIRIGDPRRLVFDQYEVEESEEKLWLIERKGTIYLMKGEREQDWVEMGKEEEAKREWIRG